MPIKFIVSSCVLKQYLPTEVFTQIVKENTPKSLRKKQRAPFYNNSVKERSNLQGMSWAMWLLLTFADKGCFTRQEIIKTAEKHKRKLLKKGKSTQLFDAVLGDLQKRGYLQKIRPAQYIVLYKVPAPTTS